MGGQNKIRTNDLGVTGSNPIANEKAPVWALFSSGGRIRTFNLRVMSCNPILCILARRATHFRVAWRAFPEALM